METRGDNRKQRIKLTPIGVRSEANTFIKRDKTQKATKHKIKIRFVRAENIVSFPQYFSLGFSLELYDACVHYSLELFSPGSNPLSEKYSRHRYR